MNTYIHGAPRAHKRRSRGGRGVARIASGVEEVLEDTGHLPMLERPVRFNGLLLAFADGA